MKVNRYATLFFIRAFDTPGSILCWEVEEEEKAKSSMELFETSSSSLSAAASVGASASESISLCCVEKECRLRVVRRLVVLSGSGTADASILWLRSRSYCGIRCQAYWWMGGFFGGMGLVLVGGGGYFYFMA